MYTSLINPTEVDIFENGKIPILGCICGFTACWPMMINVIETEDKMIWTDFEQPYRIAESHNFWDYTHFGQFNFEKDNYNEQIEKLRIIADKSID